MATRSTTAVGSAATTQPENRKSRDDPANRAEPASVSHVLQKAAAEEFTAPEDSQAPT